MNVKAVLLCASLLLIERVTSQCCPVACDAIAFAPRPCAATLAISPYPLPDAPNIPAGMSICSDNLLITGPVIVAGKLPFAGTVALEGALPACGAGSVAYGCDGFGFIPDVPVGYAPCGCGVIY